MARGGARPGAGRKAGKSARARGGRKSKAVAGRSGPFIEFGNAWYSAGAIRRIYPDRMFIAGEMGSTQ